MKRRVRFSIAGLMFAVLIASLAFAAIRAESAVCQGIVLLLSRGVLGLAVVGVFCTKGAERVWWLGFAVFGLGYLGLVRWELVSGWARFLPTTIVFDSIWALLAPGEATTRGKGQGVAVFPESYFQYVIAAHSLWTLLIAALGGGLAVFFFPASAAEAQQPAAAALAPARTRSKRRLVLRALVVLSAAGVLIAAAISMPGGTGASTLYLLTWALFGGLILGAVFGAGRARAVCLGGAFFGAGYLLMIFAQPADSWSGVQIPANRLLDAFRPWLPPALRGYPGSSPKIVEANARIAEALDRSVPMHFPEEVRLEDFLKTIRAATRGAYGQEIPIFVDPIGLQEAERTPYSVVQIDLPAVPLSTSLRLALEQLGMTYQIQGGLLKITSQTSGDNEPPGLYEDPFLLAGHCVLALCAAGVGTILALLITRARRARESPAAG